MALDYRALEERAKVLQARVLELSSKDEISAAEDAELQGKMGEIRALEETAGQMRDAELEELRGIVARSKEAGAAGAQEDPRVAAFMDYLKTGATPPDLQNASLSVTDANGGYLVPEPKHAQLIEKIRKNDPIFGNATHFDMTGGDTSLLLPYKSAHGVVTTATETGARTEQNAPTFTSPTLVCYDYYTDQRATQQFLDSVTGSEDMLLNWIYEDVQEQAGVDATAGDGTTKIKGLFAETANYTTKLSGSAGALVNTNFLTVLFALPLKYRRNAKWIMTGATLGVVAAMAHPASANVLLCTQSQDGTWMILGKPVVESDSAPAIGAANYPVAFADIGSAYAVGTHRQTSILRDPYTATPKIRFYGLARMGGCAWDYQAAILLKSNNT